MRISRAIRLLHYFLLVSAVYQLLSSEWMIVPEPGKLAGVGVALFYLHAWLFGWIALTAACVYALKAYYEPETWRMLMPWFSTSRLATLFASARREVPDMLRGRLAPLEVKSPLASAVHGLGIILLIGLGMTGLYLMLGVRSDGSMSADVLVSFKFHEIMGILAWAFLAGHVLMTLYHLALRHPHVEDIFDLRKK